MATFNPIGQILPDSLSEISHNKVNKNTSSQNFGDVLKETLNSVNKTQHDAEKASIDLATGEIKDIHQAALAINKAELNLKMVLEVRNKAISAYKEILRTQI
jgi:flagellar hook-basal body complex protein FliE